MITATEFAAKLNGRTYRNEMTKEEEAEAKEAGLVVLFGASDDLAEFRGAIDDEIGCSDGGDILLTRSGVVADDGATQYGDFCCEYKKRAIESMAIISALWCDTDEAAWTYGTNIPHSTFRIMEDDDVYCVGIVFRLADLPESR